jgi:hypothetical protein
MDFNPPEIIEKLKEQRRFYQEQLRLVDIALAAIKSEKRSGIKVHQGQGRQQNDVKKHRIPWTKEIERLIDNYDEFNLIELQNDLAEKRGITAAMTITGRNVISNTLSRFIKRGRIERIGPGVYKVITESI